MIDHSREWHEEVDGKMWSYKSLTTDHREYLKHWILVMREFKYQPFGKEIIESTEYNAILNLEIKMYTYTVRRRT